MRLLTIFTILLLTLTSIQWSMAQSHLEVIGEAQIINMPKDNAADSVVVRLADGTLGVRDVSTLTSGSSSPWYLGKDTLGGIVFYIYKGSDGQDPGLVVSKTESTAIWQNTGTVTGATRSWDGVFNMGLMTDSPAKDWITSNFSSEWYLPSIDELNLLWHNRFHANQALSAGGLTLLSYANYWSSTEFNATDARYFWFVNGTANTTNKTNNNSVRAIRAF
jgi:hypothetical protein